MAQVDVAGRVLEISNLDKVMFPETGFTKGQMIDYYARIGPVLLPHLAERPLTLIRYPDGVDGGHFYEKRKPKHAPDWVRSALVPSGRYGEVEHVVCADLPTLVWLANLAAIELHPLLARAEAVDRPRLLMFDLDPGPPAGVLDAAEVAVIVHDLLADAGFEPLVKTSGSKGVHVAVPLDGVHDYTPIRLLSRHVAEYLERTHRERCVSTQDKARRAGKVLVDWNQNGPTNTTASVYSLRARAMPQVSTPVTWDEIAAAVAAKDPAALQFGPEAVLARIAEHGDLWSAAVTSTTPSAPALARLARLLGD